MLLNKLSVSVVFVADAACMLLLNKISEKTKQNKTRQKTEIPIIEN